MDTTKWSRQENEQHQDICDLVRYTDSVLGMGTFYFKRGYVMNEEDYQAVRKVLLDTIEQLDDKRNDTIEEVAQAIEEMRTAFGADTIASFAAYVRGMKR